MEWANENNDAEQFRIRFYHSDPFGRHLYFIEISDWGEFFPEFNLETSLKVDVNGYHRLKKIIKVLVSRKTSSATRKLFAKEFFKIMPYLIPDIQNHYFQNEELDKYGKYNEAWKNTYQGVISNFKLIPYIPFSPLQNEIIFNKINKAYVEGNEKEFGVSVEAERDLFEQNLINDNLKFAYTEVYTNPAKYYFQETRRNDELLEFYYMTSADGQLLLWFLVNIR